MEDGDCSAMTTETEDGDCRAWAMETEELGMGEAWFSRAIPKEGMEEATAARVGWGATPQAGAAVVVGPGAVGVGRGALGAGGAAVVAGAPVWRLASACSKAAMVAASKSSPTEFANQRRRTGASRNRSATRVRPASARGSRVIVHVSRIRPRSLR